MENREQKTETDREYLSPEATITIQDVVGSEPETISFRELGKRIGITDLDTPEIYDIRDQGLEILSWDHETNSEVWRPLNAYVVKANAQEHYQVNTLHGTKDHRIWADGKYVRLEDYAGAELVKSPIQVVDCEVEDTHNYIAEGQINHNTTTPGGMAIPYACSVRLRISAGKPIEINNQTVGIGVTVKTIKNKISRPFREASFEIHFGKGVREPEQLFDTLRTHCAGAKDGVKSSDGLKTLYLEGTSAWKSFRVVNQKTGEVEREVKFYKNEFEDKILNVPEFKPYILDMMDAALIIRPEDLEHHTFSSASEPLAENEQAA